MAALKIRRLNAADSKFAKNLIEFRKNIKTATAVGPANGKETKKIFGEALTPLRMAERICADVQKDGVSAILKYTSQLDKIKLTAEGIRVPAEKLAAAHAAADPEFLDTLRNVRQNILSFQMGVLHTDAVLTVSGSHELQLRYRPMNRVGVCMPDGSGTYPSILLMTVVPAQAAGVAEIAVAIPPSANGADNQDLLAVCHELGVKEVYRLGGAQAVAAFAYGVEGIPAVNMIVGPGNHFASLAKRVVYGSVAVDCLTGPTDLVIVGDDQSKPEFIASDMIAQAEQAPGVAILITWGETLPDAVSAALNRQIAKYPKTSSARDSLEKYAAIIRVANADAAVDLANQLSPELLQVQTRDPEIVGDRVINAGAIFLGHFTPVALGDYAAGPSHVLPTASSARFASGLTANDFMRRTSVMSFTQRGVRVIADDVNRLAGKEGQNGHIASVVLRVNDHPTPRPPKKVNKSDTIVKARR